MKFIGIRQKKIEYTYPQCSGLKRLDSLYNIQRVSCKYIHCCPQRLCCVSSFASFAFISSNDSSRIYRYYSMALVHADVTNFGVAQNTCGLQTKDLPPIKWFGYFYRCRNRLMPLRECANECVYVSAFTYIIANSLDACAYHKQKWYRHKLICMYYVSFILFVLRHG